MPQVENKPARLNQTNSTHFNEGDPRIRGWLSRKCTRLRGGRRGAERPVGAWSQRCKAAEIRGFKKKKGNTSNVPRLVSRNRAVYLEKNHHNCIRWVLEASLLFQRSGLLSNWVRKYSKRKPKLQLTSGFNAVLLSRILVPSSTSDGWGNKRIGACFRRATAQA
jgi:hypothetical protein